MRKCRIDRDVLKERRSQLKEKMLESSAIVMTSSPEAVRNNDVHHPYRQESSFYYLTGFEEPESVMVFRPGQDPEYTLFVRPKDPEMETWEGFRFGKEGAVADFDANQAFHINELDEKLPELLTSVDHIYYRFNLHNHFDSQFLRLVERVQKKKGRGATKAPALHDPSEIIGDLRLIKTPYEVEIMQEAARVSAQGHIAAMKFARPGVNEREVHAILNYMFMMGGAAREGYGSIVASGNNATTLHYTFNDQACNDGDLLLIDAGAEVEYYSGDITRTFPVNGKFTDSQKVFYQAVLDVQKEIIEMSQPGLPFTTLQEKTTEFLTEAMLELKLLSGSKEELIETKAFKKYYPHGVSHFLGMDVHDTGSIMLNGTARKLAPGMCFTVEPGLYVPEGDDSAPEEFRGLGVRIEDDILITVNGYENLTSIVPKEVSDLEQILAQPLEAQA